MNKIEIHELVNRYAYYLDKANVESCFELFTNDATLELRIGKAQGKEEIYILLNKILNFTKGKRHFISNIICDIQDNTANSYSYLLVVDASDSTKVIMTGVYEDELVKENEKWKIKNRRVVVDPSFK